MSRGSGRKSRKRTEMPLGAGVHRAGWEAVTGTRTGLLVLQTLTRPSSFWKQER